jgi:hypothetical protein
VETGEVVSIRSTRPHRHPADFAGTSERHFEAAPELLISN